MSNPNDTTTRLPSPALVLGGLFILYLGSIGPAARLTQEGFISKNSQFCETLFGPILWVMERSELVGDLVFEYIELWGA
jgi:hypothetical protein